MRIIVYIWPDIDIYAMWLFFGELCFLGYMYYTHPSYQTSIVGKNCAYSNFYGMLKIEICQVNSVIMSRQFVMGREVNVWRRKAKHFISLL